jgi:hypothetical protein
MSEAGYVPVRSILEGRIHLSLPHRENSSRLNRTTR